MKQNSQALRFVAVGGFAAAANFLSRGLFEAFSPFWLAIICSYIVGMAIAFFLNFKIVFPGSNSPIRSQIWKFIVVNILSALQVWGIAVALEYWLLPNLNVVVWREEISHGIGICIPIFTSYFAHKLWTFK